MGDVLHRFEVRLDDRDRGRRETLEFRAARHPSETAEHLFARVLAYALEWREGLSFSAGLSTRGVPAIHVLGPGGEVRTWIDVGAPDGRRLHRASLGGAEVVVYTWRDPARLARDLARTRIHRAEALRIVGLDLALLAALAARLERRVGLSLLREGARLEIGVGGEALVSEITSRTLA